MQDSQIRRRIAVVALGALTVGSISYAVSATGAHPTTAASTATECRASTARVMLAGEQVLEPFVADDCKGEDAGVINPTTSVGPIDLRVLYASTHPAYPNAEAGVADISINLSQLNAELPDIGVQLLKSEAGVKCVGGEPKLQGKSRVAGLTVDGEDALVIPPDDEMMALPENPLVHLAVNEQETSGTTLTQRALHLTVLPGALDLDVVIAESIAGYTGNPCAPTNPPTTTAPPTTQPPTSAPPALVGWMNGGGQVGPKEVQHAFVLPCTLAQERPGPNLTIEVPNAGRFKLTSLSEVSCRYDSAQGAPEQPKAGFNTIEGKGVGTCGKGKSVDVSFRFTDEGEPAAGRDESSFTVGDGSGPDPCDFTTSGLINGNHQAHRGTNPPA